MVPWIKWRGSGAEAEKQTQTFTSPPSRFTVGGRFFSPSMLVFDCDQIILFEMSVQRMDFQKASSFHTLPGNGTALQILSEYSRTCFCPRCDQKRSATI